MTDAPVPLAEQIAVINRVMMRPRGMPSPHRDFYEEARDEREATVLIAAIATLQQHERAISDRDDLQRTFDLQWAADQRAIKRWQEAHPGNDLVWPDRANMVVWLMDQLDAATATFDDEEAGHQETLRLWQEAKQQRERAMAALRKSRQALELIVSIQETAKISRTNENAAFVDWRDLAAASGDAQEALAALDDAANTAGDAG